MWNDWVWHLFPSFIVDEPLAQEDDDHRHSMSCAAPAAFMHQSFAAPAASVCQESFAEKQRRPSFADHSVSRLSFEAQSGSLLESPPAAQAPMSARHQSFQAPMSARQQSFAAAKAPSFDVTSIPFKDGSSQLAMRSTATPRATASAERPFGTSFMQSQAYRDREDQFMISDPEDLVDVKVAEYFKANPQVYLKTRVARSRPGVYCIYGREIVVDFEESDGVDRPMNTPGQLVVKDGPLKQPFADYLAMKDTTAEYNSSVFQAKNNLQTIPKECRMTFNDPGCDYSRIDAMKVANEQAIVREAAAKVMMTQGQAPAVNRLRCKYEKTIDMKLGNNMRHKRTHEVRPHLGGGARGLPATQM